MKLIFGILLFISLPFFGVSQYVIDWRNAPLNPIPVKYTLNHFMLTGPVKKAVIDDLLGKQILFFNSFGKLDSSIIDDFLGHEKKIFEYDSTGNLSSIISLKKYGTPIRNYVTINLDGQLIRLNKTTYGYNQAGFLVSISEDEKTIQYSYNKDNQLSKKETYNEEDRIALTVFFYYKQYAKYIRVEENRVRGTDQDDNIWTYEYDPLGHQFHPNNVYDYQSNYIGPTPNKTEAVIEYF